MNRKNAEIVIIENKINKHLLNIQQLQNRKKILLSNTYQVNRYDINLWGNRFNNIYKKSKISICGCYRQLFKEYGNETPSLTWFKENYKYF